MSDIFQYEFLRNAVIIGVLASVACGVIGSYVVVKRIVSVSGGMSHAVFGGIGLGYFLGFNPLYGALIFSLAASLLVGLAREYFRNHEDTLIGMMWAIGMALGILFISLSPGYPPDLFSYLFGNILTVPFSDLVLTAILDLVVVGIFVVFYKDILGLALDEEFVRIQGRPALALSLLLWATIGVVIVLLIKIVGIVLVISLLTIPPATASLFVRRFSRMIVLSSIFGCAFTLLGLFLSYRYDLTSGASIILVSAAGYLIAQAGKRLFKIA